MPRVARSFDNYPAILFDFQTATSGGPARRLANISYSPPGDVEIVDGLGAVRKARLAVLECRTVDRNLSGYFFRIAEAILFDGGSLISEPQFDSAFDALVKLFSALQRPGRLPLQGLWVELAMIAWSEAPSEAISSWHSSSRALHDFSAGHFRLEVKGTARGLREHAFLLDQLAQLPQGETLIASVMLTETSDGATIYDLLALITARAEVTREQVLRVEAIVAESLGNGWEDAHELRFDLDAALQSLRLFPASAVPCVGLPLPAQVKDVSFVADLSSASSIEIEEARSRASFFADLLPPS